MSFAHLADDEVCLVGLQLSSCWRSVCDFACVSRRTASSLLSQKLWHAAALSYFGEPARCSDAALKLLLEQVSRLEKLVATPDVWGIRRTSRSKMQRLRSSCPLLSAGNDYPELSTDDLDACLPSEDRLRAALELVARLEGEQTLGSLVGAAREPLVLALHKMLHSICCDGLRFLGRTPLLHHVKAAWMPLRHLSVPPPYYIETLWDEADINRDDATDEDREKALAAKKVALEWLGTQQVGALRGLLEGVMAALDGLHDQAVADRIAGQVALASNEPETALPASAWRALIVRSEAAEGARRLCKVDNHRVLAMHIARSALDPKHNPMDAPGCLDYMTPRGMLRTIELLLTCPDEPRIFVRHKQPEYSYDNEPEPFPLRSYGYRDARAMLDELTETFRDGAGRKHVAAVLQHVDEAAWEEVSEDDEVLTSPILHWIAFYVLGCPSGSGWHPAWHPGTLSAWQHAMLLAIRLHWTNGWCNPTKLGMLLGPSSAWPPRKAAEIIHKALRYKLDWSTGDTAFVPSNVWTFWRALANAPDQDENSLATYVLTADVAWQLADRWLGSRGRCASLFSAALLCLDSSRRRGILECADADRRQMLAAAAAQSASRIFGPSDGVEQEDEEDEDDQYASDDSCAAAEAGWGEWSWELHGNSR